MSRPIKRIALASGLVVTVIAGALVLTVSSYRSALVAHDRALAAVSEIAVSHAAETYLFREREAIDEYLLTRDRALLAEVELMRTGFRRTLSDVGVGKPRETLLVRRALEVNEELLATFAAEAAAADRKGISVQGLGKGLNALEDRNAAPLHALRSINEMQRRDAVRRASSSIHRALLEAILAGVLAIAGGLAFAVYAVQLVREIESRNERLHELDSLKNDFVASVSHELRTPLTSIRGYLELVLDGEAGELDDEQRHFLSIVERNADRLLQVVGDLLFVAQVEAGKIALEPGPTDLAELARQAVEAARPAATEKNIDLELDLDGRGELQADRARLAQVLDNLISNAVKFTPAGGRVAVRTFRSGDVAVLEVADTGMGLSAQDQEQLFERFFRAESATEQAIQGTGLGLAIVKAIVEAHDGAISVVSARGEGTTFRVELPLEREQVAA